jgi:hypothetical protein
LKIIAAKRLELGLSTEVIRGLESEITAIRNGNSARGTETSARVETASATNAQTDAMDKLEMRYKLSANYTERQIALLEREAVAAEKAVAAELKRLNIDKDKFSVDKNGNRITVGGLTPDAVFNEAKSRGLSDDTAQQLRQRYAQISNKNDPRFGDFEALYAEIRRLKQLEAQQPNGGGLGAAGNPSGGAGIGGTNTGTPAPSPTPSTAQTGSGNARTVNIQVGGNSYAVNTDAQSADNLIKAFKQSARSAGR